VNEAEEDEAEAEADDDDDGDGNDGGGDGDGCWGPWSLSRLPSPKSAIFKVAVRTSREENCVVVRWYDEMVACVELWW
jgi:hypothetical protein